MSVRMRRLYGPTFISNLGTLVYTVPAGRTAICHNTIIDNSAGVSVTWDARINGSTFARGTLPGGTFTGLSFFCLNPGDTLTFAVSVLNGIKVSGFGSLLDGAPA